MMFAPFFLVQHDLLLQIKRPLACLRAESLHFFISGHCRPENPDLTVFLILMLNVAIKQIVGKVCVGNENMLFPWVVLL